MRPPTTDNDWIVMEDNRTHGWWHRNWMPAMLVGLFAVGMVVIGLVNGWA